MKPLTRYFETYDGLVPSENNESGEWYAKDEADARFAEIEAENLHTENLYAREIERRKDAEAERDAARAELDRKRVLRNSDQTRSRCKHFAICLAEIALNGSKEAEAAFRAVMPLVSTSHPSRREVKDAARIASGGVFGVSDDPYQDAARGAA